MAWSREVRLPLLDRRIAEFALSLPAEFIFAGGVSKRILRQAGLGHRSPNDPAPARQGWLRASSAILAQQPAVPRENRRGATRPECTRDRALRRSSNRGGPSNRNLARLGRHLARSQRRDLAPNGPGPSCRGPGQGVASAQPVMRRCWAKASRKVTSRFAASPALGGVACARARVASPRGRRASHGATAPSAGSARRPSERGDVERRGRERSPSRARAPGRWRAALTRRLRDSR